jgi:hypothetical protein
MFDKALSRLIDTVQAFCVVGSGYLIYLRTVQTELMAVVAIVLAGVLALAFEGKRRTQVLEGLLYMSFLGSLHMWTFSGQNFFWGLLILIGIVLCGINLATIFTVAGKAIGKEY